MSKVIAKAIVQVATPVLLGCAAAAAHAIDGAAVLSSEDSADPASVDVRSETRVERNDATALPLRSAPGARTDQTELSVQRWVGRGRASIGVGVGSVMLVERQNGIVPGLYGGATSTPQASGSLLMLGLRYRAGDQASVYANTTRVRGYGLRGDDQAVVGKVGVEFKAAKSYFNIGYGGLGFRLDGDARMTLKVRRGGLMVGMQRSF